jgi:sec-independent protein translocase protein TatA
MPFKLGPLEIILILVIVLVIFGVGKLPQIGSALGKTMKAFKTGQADDEEEEVKPRSKARKKAAKRPAEA